MNDELDKYLREKLAESEDFTKLLADNTATPTAYKISHTVPISLEMLASIDPEAARARGWVEPPPSSKYDTWRWRVSVWWYEHWPRMHFGPCNHEDCE